MQMVIRLLVVVSCLIAPLPAQAQNYGSPQPAGADGMPSVIPAGKYVLTNVATGRTVYVMVTAAGDVYVKDPPAVQPTVPPQQPQSKYGVVPGLLQRQPAPYGMGDPAAGMPAQYGSQPYGQQAGYAQQPYYPQQPAYQQGQPGASPVFGLPQAPAGFGP